MTTRLVGGKLEMQRGMLEMQGIGTAMGVCVHVADLFVGKTCD